MIVVAHADGYWLILPTSLAGIVQKRLQMYVLRSAVKISLSDINILGIKTEEPFCSAMPLPNKAFEFTIKDSCCWLKIPSAHDARYLYFAIDTLPPELAELASAKADLWRLDDIDAGLPWFEADQSEVYTPHMLNLDKLGGISLDKGCYTGQEIIARTHYLGKNKRHLYAGQINSVIDIQAGLGVLDPISAQTLGHILFAQPYDQITRLLMVLNLETDHLGGYAIDNSTQSAVELLS